MDSILEILVVIYSMAFFVDIAKKIINELK